MIWSLTFIGSYSYASAQTVFGGTWNAHTFEDSSFEFIFFVVFSCSLVVYLLVNYGHLHNVSTNFLTRSSL
uniref:p8 n=1 Tax=Hibiscus-infecting cilevirus TaxID=2054415 RepID=A0A8K1IAR1_9VIRU|nr:p8 [Hibiscus-infecting cilevirus]